MSSKTKAITERMVYAGILDGTIDQDVLIQFAEKKLAQLDSRNEKAKQKAAEKRKANDELLETVYNCLTVEFQTREEIFNRVVESNPDITIGKVGYRLTALVNEERAQKTTISMAGEEGKTRKITAYALA